MAYDGSLKFDTLIDDKKFKSGLAQLQGLAGGAGKAVAGAFAAAGAGIGAAVKVGMSFESSMSQVAATMGITADAIANGSEEYKILEEAAKKAGATTMFSASQAAEALNYLALAGYDASTAAEVLPSVLNLAAAGGMDLAYASDLATDAMAALGIEATDKNLTHFGDEMAKTAQKSNTSVAQLGEAILVCAGQAKGAGQSLETMNTALGVMANRGLKGSEGGTHLRNILKSLVAPTSAASKQLSALGLKAADSEGNIRDLGDIMADLKKKLANLTQEKQLQVLNSIFNSRDIAAAQALLAGVGDEWDNLKTQISNADGAMADMAETMNDNLKGKLTILGSSLAGLGIAVYDGIKNPLKDAVGSAIDSVGRLSSSITEGELKPAIENMGTLLGSVANDLGTTLTGAARAAIAIFSVLGGHIVGVTSSVAGLAAAIISFKGLTSGVLAVQKAFEGFQKIMASTNPYVLAAAAIAGVVTALAVFIKKSRDAYKATDEYKKSVDGIRDRVSETTRSVHDLNSSIKEHTSAALEETDKLTLYKNELLGLVDANGRVKESDRDRVNFLIGELNSALGMEISMTDGVINKYNELKDSIDDVILKKRAMALLDSLQDDYEDAISNQTKSLLEMGAAYRKITSLSREIKEFQDIIDSGGTITDAQLLKWHKLQNELDNVTQTYNEAAANVANSSETIADYQELTAAVAENSSDRIQAACDQWETHQLLTNDKVAGDTESTLKNIRGTINEYVYGLAAAIEQGNDSACNAAETGLKSVLAEYQRMGGDVEALTPLFDSVGLTIGNYLTEGTAEGVENGEPEIEGATTSVTTEATNAAAAVASSGGENIGDNVVAGFVKSMVNGTPKMVAAATTAGQAVISAFKSPKVFDEHSPSRVMRNDVGAMLVEGLKIGITEHIDEVPEAFKNLMDDIKLQLELGAISEAEYYKKLEEYRDEYLKKGSDEWWNYTKEIIKYEDKLTEEQRDREFKRLENLKELRIISERDYYKQLEALRDKYIEQGSDDWEDYTLKIAKYYQGALDDMAAEYASKLDDVHDKMDSLKDKFDSYFSLSHTVTLTLEKQGVEYDQDFDVLNTDIGAYTESLKDWNNVLSDLKNRDGMTDSYMRRLLNEAPNVAYSLVQQLQRMSDDEFGKYMQAYNEYEEELDRQSKLFYKDEEDEIAAAAREFGDTFVSEIADSLGDLDRLMERAGYSSAQAFADEFMQQLEKEMTNVTILIAGTGEGIYVGSGAANYQYNTYQIAGGSETTAQQLRACRDASERERLRGGYS